MPYSALLFDLDGTLVDTITLYEKAVVRVFAELGIHVPHEEFRRWYFHAVHLKENLAAYGLTEDKVPGVRARRDELYIDLLRSEVTWHPSGKELLEKLQGTVPMALITGSWMTYVDAIDSRLDVKRFFDPIITADLIHKFMKPHPHGLLLACDALKVDPKNCLYIGDQQFDIGAAKAAGMEVWLLRGEWTPESANGATREFTSLCDIQQALH